jgi:hypothetical protein
VQYEELAEDPAVLAKLCGRIGIPMFERKQDFWTGKHHTLFGNNSAKVSLLSPDHPRFQTIRTKRGEFEGDSPASVVHHRSILRESRKGDVEPSVRNGVQWERIERVENALRARSISVNGNFAPANSRAIKMPTAGVVESSLHCALFLAREILGSVRLRHMRQL